MIRFSSCIPLSYRSSLKEQHTGLIAPKPADRKNRAVGSPARPALPDKSPYSFWPHHTIYQRASYTGQLDNNCGYGTAVQILLPEALPSHAMSRYTPSLVPKQPLCSPSPISHRHKLNEHKAILRSAPGIKSALLPWLLVEKPHSNLDNS